MCTYQWRLLIQQHLAQVCHQIHGLLGLSSKLKILYSHRTLHIYRQCTSFTGIKSACATPTLEGAGWKSLGSRMGPQVLSDRTVLHRGSSLKHNGKDSLTPGGRKWHKTPG